MNKTKPLILNASLVLLVSLSQGCTSYEPVFVAECNKVVKHAQQILGKLSPPYQDLLKSCKAASDDKRGCILAAKKVGRMTQCS
ncbi:MAG: hypothetical protein ACI84K_000229 [Pseudohongiellaceae bacterium]|jgi:hypothetical protein